MQKINTNISNMLKYLNKRQDMLFCNKMLNVHFCTKSVWLKRRTGQKTPAAWCGNTSPFSAPQKYSSREQYREKFFPGRSSRGGRITGAGFLLQKNTFFQKGRPVPALNRPEHFISGLPALPEGNPFRFIIPPRRLPPL